MKRTSLLLIVLLAGCAINYAVVKMGDSTYQVSAVAAPARGGIAGAEHMALDHANQQCTSLSKKITVTNIETGHDFPANGRAVVTFTCT